MWLKILVDLERDRLVPKLEKDENIGTWFSFFSANIPKKKKNLKYAQFIEPIDVATEKGK